MGPPARECQRKEKEDEKKGIGNGNGRKSPSLVAALEERCGGGGTLRVGDTVRVCKVESPSSWEKRICREEEKGRRNEKGKKTVLVG
jgi:hypothetical protein